MIRAGSRRVLLTLALTATALGGTAAPAAAVDDAQVVFCLSGAQVDHLRDAAVALGKAQDRAQVQDVAAWRTRDPDAFDDTCEALFGAAKPQPGFFADLLPFLTALTAAVLAYWAALGQERRVRRRTKAEALTAALAEFDSAARAYADHKVGDRPVERLRVAHTALVTRVLDVRVERPRWKSAEEWYLRLTGGALSVPALTGGWGGDKTARGEEVVALVDDLRTGVGQLATHLAKRAARPPGGTTR
ncbi:hypothetical protein GCM10023148_07430 [Actinokineospora soli]